MLSSRRWGDDADHQQRRSRAHGEHDWLVPVTSVRDFVRRLDATLGEVVDNLLATYLHGSAALGGFVAGRSDIDVLAVCEDRPIPHEELRLAAQTLQSHTGPGRGVELSMVTRSHAREPGPPWPFLLHVATCPGHEKTVFGAEHPGDPDLLMHYAVCRAAGIAVRGLAPTELIGPIARADVLAYLHAELGWALEHAPAAYGILNACRALAYRQTGEILSKVAGAQYARGRGGPRELITGALAMHRGARPDQPPSPAARRFIAEVRDALDPVQR
jgi:hypothetical protein